MLYVHTYTHGNGRIGVMIEFEVPDEATVQTSMFQQFALDTALHIASEHPSVISPEDLGNITPIRSGVSGIRSQALLEQQFVKDRSRLFRDVLNELESELGVLVHIRRFARYGSR